MFYAYVECEGTETDTEKYEAGTLENNAPMNIASHGCARAIETL